MRCKKCGTEISAGAVICTGCFSNVADLIATGNVTREENEVVANGTFSEKVPEPNSGDVQSKFFTSPVTANTPPVLKQEEKAAPSIADIPVAPLEKEEAVDIQIDPGLPLEEISFAPPPESEGAGFHTMDLTSSGIDLMTPTEGVPAEISPILEEEPPQKKPVKKRSRRKGIVLFFVFLMMIGVAAFFFVFFYQNQKRDPLYLSFVEKKDDAYVYIGTDGKIRKISGYDTVGTFYGNFAIATKKNGETTHYAIIDETGREVVKSGTYSKIYADNLSEGFIVWDREGKKCGYINKKGKLVLKTEYDLITSAYPGVNVLLVQKGEKYGLTDVNGKIVFDIMYAIEDMSSKNVRSISSLYYLIELDGTTYLMGNNGKRLRSFINAALGDVGVTEGGVTVKDMAYILGDKHPKVLFEKERLKEYTAHAYEENGYVGILTDNETYLFDLSGRQLYRGSSSSNSLGIYLGKGFYVVNQVIDNTAQQARVYVGRDLKRVIDKYIVVGRDLKERDDSFGGTFWLSALESTEGAGNRYLFNRKGKKLSTSGSEDIFVFADGTLLDIAPYRSIKGYEYLENGVLKEQYENYIIVENQEQQFGLLDKSGKVVIPFDHYASIVPFTEHIVLVNSATPFLFDCERNVKIAEFHQLDISHSYYDAVRTKEYMKIAVVSATGEAQSLYYSLDGTLLYSAVG